MVTTCIEKISDILITFFPILRKNINDDDWANRPRVGGKFTPAKCMKNYNRKYLSERHRLVMMIIIKKECKPQENSTKFIRYSKILLNIYFLLCYFAKGIIYFETLVNGFVEYYFFMYLFFFLTKMII